MKKFELFTVPQRDRVAALETIAMAWMNDLLAGEQLVVGLPQVLGKWDECTPLILGQGMQDQFLAWLQENTKSIEGPVYNLPALTADFLCMIIDENFDPRTEATSKDASNELKGALVSLGNFMTQYESQAA